MISIVPEFWWMVFGIGLTICVAVGIVAGVISAFTYREKQDGKR